MNAKDVSSLEFITLPHMNQEIDDDELLSTDLPGRAKLLAIRAVQAHYRGIMRQLKESEEKFYQQRALDTAKYLAISDLPKLGDAAEDAWLFLSDEANRTGWFTQDYFTYQTLDELLASTWGDEEASRSELSDRKFVVTELLPAARDMGIPAGELLSVTMQNRKMRRLVPTARQLINRDDITPEEKKEGMDMLIGLAANPRVHYAEFDEKLDVFNGKIAKEPEVIQGAKYIVPGGDTVFFVRVQGSEQERIVELALKNRVELPLTDLTQLFKDVLAMLKSGRAEIADDSTFLPKLISIFEGASYGKASKSVELPVD
jgi:hypothetical protein